MPHSYGNNLTEETQQFHNTHDSFIWYTTRGIIIVRGDQSLLIFRITLPTNLFPMIIEQIYELSCIVKQQTSY